MIFYDFCANYAVFKVTPVAYVINAFRLPLNFYHIIVENVFPYYCIAVNAA